jgi:hypothetical protein
MGDADDSVVDCQGQLESERGGVRRSLRYVNLVQLSSWL